MAINLSRNTRVFLTTRLNADGSVPDTSGGFISTNTWELNILDGYSFGQTTQQASVTVEEAGVSPIRSGRTFNTQLSAVDWSFSTYIRPGLVGGFVSPAERILWNATLGDGAMDETGYTVSTAPSRATATGAGASTATVNISASGTNSIAALQVLNLNGFSNAEWNQPVTVISVTPAAGTGTVTATVEYARAPNSAAGLASTAVGTATGFAYTGQWARSVAVNTTATVSSYGYVSTMNANKSQLQRFGLIFAVDNQVYTIDNCAVESVAIDFGMANIAMCAWSGKGVKLNSVTAVSAASITASTGLAAASYITNKLSTMTLQSNLGGSDNTAGGTASVAFSIPLTGGNINIANNLTYLIPNNIGVVNQPINYFTGERNITGNVTAYLRTGASNDMGTLLKNMLAAASYTTEPKFRMNLEIGGINTANRIEFDMRGVNLQIPTINVADVIAATINFNAQPFTPDVVGNIAPSYDLARANELVVRYYAT